MPPDSRWLCLTRFSAYKVNKVQLDCLLFEGHWSALRDFMHRVLACSTHHCGQTTFHRVSDKKNTRRVANLPDASCNVVSRWCNFSLTWAHELNFPRNLHRKCYLDIVNCVFCIGLSELRASHAQFAEQLVHLFILTDRQPTDDLRSSNRSRVLSEYITDGAFLLNESHLLRRRFGTGDMRNEIWDTILTSNSVMRKYFIRHCNKNNGILRFINASAEERQRTSNAR